MTTYREFNVGGSGRGPFGFFGPLIALAFIFAVLYFVASGFFWLLSWVALPIFIITLIMDHKVVLDYINFVFKLLKENTIVGVIAVLVTFFGYPFVAGYLFMKALGKRQIKKMVDHVEKESNTFSEYQEVKEEEDFLELPPLQQKKPQPQSRNNDYDDMFN
jgi:hypothetical protein